MPKTKRLPKFSQLALAVSAALVATAGYTDFLHLRYLP